MKKYTRPTVEIVELQSRETIAADTNPIQAATFVSGDTVTTVYNLAMVADTSYKA